MEKTKNKFRVAPNLKKPIFIMGAHKSGTSLIRSLLDSHPSLSVLPTETHFFGNSGCWVYYHLRKKNPKRCTREELIGDLIKGVHILSDFRSQFSDNPEFEGYNIEKFEKQIQLYDLSNIKNQFNAYIHSLYYALYGTEIPASYRIVEKSTDSTEFAYLLNTICPDASFIHIVRNPYSNIASMRRAFFISGRYPVIQPFFEALRFSAYYLFKNSIGIERYLTIRYEDLVQETRSILSRICSFIGIEFDEILMQPSSEGKDWYGNSTVSNKIIGISKERVGFDDVRHIEIYLVNRHMQDFLREFSYPQLRQNRRLRFSTQGESLIVYLKNRIYALWG